MTEIPSYDLSIHSNPDARAWARLFQEVVLDAGITVDEGLMQGWFANAMMAMHDHVKRPEPSQPAGLASGRAPFVFAAVTSRDREGEDVIAICSSAEKALAALAAHCVENGRLSCMHDNHDVERWEIDVGFRDYTSAYRDDLEEAASNTVRPTPTARADE